jgi:hypothetical protein
MKTVMSPSVPGHRTSFPRTREPMLNWPVTLSMDSRFCGNDVGWLFEF